MCKGNLHINWGTNYTIKYWCKIWMAGNLLKQNCTIAPSNIDYFHFTFRYFIITFTWPAATILFIESHHVWYFVTTWYYYGSFAVILHKYRSALTELPNKQVYGPKPNTDVTDNPYDTKYKNNWKNNLTLLTTPMLENVKTKQYLAVASCATMTFGTTFWTDLNHHLYSTHSIPRPLPNAVICTLQFTEWYRDTKDDSLRIDTHNPPLLQWFCLPRKIGSSIIQRRRQG